MVIASYQGQEYLIAPVSRGGGSTSSGNCTPEGIFGAGSIISIGAGILGLGLNIPFLQTCKQCSQLCYEVLSSSTSTGTASCPGFCPDANFPCVDYGGTQCGPSCEDTSSNVGAIIVSSILIAAPFICCIGYCLMKSVNR